MTGTASAAIRLTLLSEREADMILRALRPETESSATHRSKVQVANEGRNLELLFESTDTTALRASINSYLSWLQLLTNIYKALELKRT